MAMVAYTVGALNSAIYAEEFGVANFLNEPGLALVQALTLQFQPAFMDILPLYIVLLGVLPLVLAGFRSWTRAMFFTSLTLWLAMQFENRIALPAYPAPDGVWFFNPLAWQALFLGCMAWLAQHSRRDFLARQSLAVLVCRGALAGGVSDPLRLDPAQFV
jgi:hypothetical protein